ncbi:ribonuclease P subunit [Theileria orientalis]|uniref:Ribonuclease P subunit n=1 Tax=Theileria orientalis TaxID=68886 RepID=A0A976QRS5_THEOR|nr:ribonuclease P subunit [Theileria orientalis]
MVKRKRSRSASRSDSRSADQSKGDRSLYQPLYDPPRSLKHSDSLALLAEKSGEPLSLWKARVENKVLHLNDPPPEQTSLLLDVNQVDYTVRVPCTKFSGISNTTAKRLGLFRVRRVPYEHALEFNSLWLEYARKVLGSPKTHLNASKLVAMLDLQGSLVEVVRSNCASYVGTVGIILRETQNGFNIVDSTSKVKFILKSSSVFRLDYDDWSFFIYGRHIAASPATRSKSKLKPKGFL